MATQTVKPVYLLIGGDPFLQDASRREVVARAVGDADPQLCVASFDAADVEPADVFDELRTLPFLAPCRVVVLRDAESFVQAHRERIESYLEKPAPSGVLVLCVKREQANTRLYKRVREIGDILSCSLDARKLPDFLRKAAKKRGKTLHRDAAELLAQWVGEDLASLDAEMEKLALYVGERGEITAEDVGALVTATAGPEAFALTNRITEGDCRGALKALDGMLQVRGQEFQALGMIGWHLRRTLQAQQLIEAGRRPEAAVGNMPRGPRQKFIAMLQRRPLGKVQQDFRRLIRADLSMKTGAGPAGAMQELVIKLCT